MKDSAPWRGEVRIEANGEIAGFLYDPTDLARRFVVELQIDGEPAGLMRAVLFEPSLAGTGDGCYGFAFARPDVAAASACAVVVANSDWALGALDLDAAPERAAARDGVRWLGGLRFEAWIEAPAPETPPQVLVEVDGETVAADAPDAWAPVRRGVVAAARRREIVLPARFADGAPRRARFRGPGGRELAGSPCDFLALAPGAAPFFEFARWLETYAPAPVEGPQTRCAVVWLGAGDLQASLDSLTAQGACAWTAALVSETGDGVTLDAEEALAFLESEATDCDCVVFAPAGAVLAPDALARLAGALRDAPAVPVAYGDLVVRAQDGGLWPLALPAFDEERLLEQGYCARVFAMRRSLAEAILRERGAADLFALFFAALPSPARGVPLHVPQFLATVTAPQLRAGVEALAAASRARLEFQGAEAEVAPARSGALFAHVRVARTQRAETVSFIVAAQGAKPRIESCLATLNAVSRKWDCEAFLVGDGASLSALSSAGPGYRRLELAAPAGLMRCANAAVTAVSGDLLMLLEPHRGEIDAEAIEELLGRAAAPDVAAVGPLIVDGEGLVASAGLTLGPGFAAADAFEGDPAALPGYADLLAVAHEVSALSPLGMVTRRALFREVDGFDLARFRRRFAEVDYGLKLRARAARLVLAPAARLVLREAPERPPAPRVPFVEDLGEDAELRQLRARWGETLAADPFYNPNLALDRPYSGLATPPRPRAPRSPAIPPARRPPPGF